MDDPRWWTSLADQLAVAADLYGRPGADLVAQWLGEQLARVDDADFARTFSDHVELSGIAPGDYAHRIVCCGAGTLLGGIRFYGRDTARPFVEVIAHTFVDLDTLCDCVSREWSAFTPRYLRLCARPGRMTAAAAILDVSIHAARPVNMTAPDGRVGLHRFADAEDAVTLITERYRRLAIEDPALARNVSPADPADVRRWHEEGRLHAIRAAGTTVGALAVVTTTEAWLSGDVVQEEVIAAGQRGHGYAAGAQAVWATDVAEDPQRLLVGTIDRHNTASRRTAERAGRPCVLERVFVALRFPAATSGQ
jgi:L-amino acid N-acyltransferase YncA